MTPIRRICLLIVPLLAGCAHVPGEVVQLSYSVGQDLVAVQASYEALVTQLYDAQRARREDYLEREWTPRFLENWIREGRLVETARGDSVWSDDLATFVTPTPGAEREQRLATVQTWSAEALLQIQTKRDSLLAPLDRDEAALLADVRQTFARLIAANAAVTAHLSSVRKVQAVQDDFLDVAGLRQARDRLQTRILDASNRAEQQLEQVRVRDHQEP